MFRYTHYYHDLSKGKDANPKVSKRKISCNCIVLDESYCFTNYLVYAYGLNIDFDPATMVLLDEDYLKKFPEIKSK